ncbi:TetR/AcrR family transcriptional regulator [Streptomyces citrinus]|uniref:TetR/AcrR family transcriptional regulator n=1 Tax=Streptomyces citrinus TaxID=3118173 RepID=UPI003CC6D0F3
MTFRALTERLATGSGAIYWHVANKGELLGAATEAVVGPVLAAESGGSPRDRVHGVALGLFGAMEEHPWLAPQLVAQLAHDPWGPVAPRLVEAIGRQVREHDDREQFLAGLDLILDGVGAS